MEAKEIPQLTSSQLLRFWRYVEKTDDHWLWRGPVSRGAYGGYGRINLDGKTFIASRISFTLAHGQIAPGLVIDHVCRVVRCINPGHLEAVTQQVNTLRGVGPTAINAQKTHCKMGHSLSGNNLYVRRGKRPGRECRVCRNASTRRYKLKGV